MIGIAVLQLKMQIVLFPFKLNYYKIMKWVRFVSSWKDRLHRLDFEYLETIYTMCILHLSTDIPLCIWEYLLVYIQLASTQNKVVQICSQCRCTLLTVSVDNILYLADIGRLNPMNNISLLVIYITHSLTAVRSPSLHPKQS